MPISDIVKLALGVIATLALLHGPLHLPAEMRKLELKILRETARTDTWGDPSLPFAKSGHRHSWTDGPRAKVLR